MNTSAVLKPWLRSVETTRSDPRAAPRRAARRRRSRARSNSMPRQRRQRGRRRRESDEGHVRPVPRQAATRPGVSPVLDSLLSSLRRLIRSSTRVHRVTRGRGGIPRSRYPPQPRDHLRGPARGRPVRRWSTWRSSSCASSSCAVVQLAVVQFAVVQFAWSSSRSSSCAVVQLAGRRDGVHPARAVERRLAGRRVDGDEGVQVLVRIGRIDERCGSRGVDLADAAPRVTCSARLRSRER